MSAKGSKSNSSGNRRNNCQGKRGDSRQTDMMSMTIRILAIVLVAAGVMIALILIRTDNSIDEESQSAETGMNSEAPTEGADNTENAEDADNALPEIESSVGLTLSSVYTSSILNPDCGGEYAEEIASLEVTNSTDSYLLSAILTAEMSDGTIVQFLVNDLPAGATAELFDTQNQTLGSGVTCTSLVCTSEEYLEADEDVLLSDTLTITVDGADAILTNTGTEALTELTVTYHCDMAGQYFGGTSYKITIDGLAAGESYTLSDDSLMGEVTVVRFTQ